MRGDFQMRRSGDLWVVVETSSKREVSEPAGELVAREICRTLNRPQLKVRELVWVLTGRRTENSGG